MKWLLPLAATLLGTACGPSTLELQRACAAQSEHYIEQEGSLIWAKNRNHYSARFGRCFLQMDGVPALHHDNAEPWWAETRIVDAFEGREYARFVEKPGDHVEACYVLQWGEPKHCNTRVEFEGLAKLYME